VACALLAPTWGWGAHAASEAGKPAAAVKNASGPEAIGSAPPKAAPRKTTRSKRSSRSRAADTPVYAALVVDSTTGAVLHEANAHTVTYPASLTKMMTLYMLFDALEKGGVQLDTPVKMSRHAASMPASKLGLAAGRSISVEDAINA